MSARNRSSSPSTTAARERSRSPHRTDEDLEVLKGLINDREEARKKKEWGTADALRVQLQNKGVQIFDKMDTWTTKDGQKWQISSPGVTVQSVSDASSDVIGTTGVDEVSPLVAEREKCRQRKDFDRADELRKEIQAKGVTIHEKEKVWTSTAGQVGLIPEWGPPSALGMELQPQVKLSEATIILLIDEREEARAAKKWAKADEIRDLLKAKGVQIFDKTQTWRSGSAQGMIIPKNKRHAMGFGGPSLQPDMFASMPTAGAMGRAVGSAAGATNAAASIGQTQAEAMYWASMMNSQMQPGMMGAMNPGFGMTGAAGGPRLASSGNDEILALIKQREISRHAKDYRTADQLRDQLKLMGVTLQETEKKWSTTDGRSGAIPQFKDLIFK